MGIIIALVIMVTLIYKTHKERHNKDRKLNTKLTVIFTLLTSMAILSSNYTQLQAQHPSGAPNYTYDRKEGLDFEDKMKSYKNPTPKGLDLEVNDDLMNYLYKLDVLKHSGQWNLDGDEFEVENRVETQQPIDKDTPDKYPKIEEGTRVSNDLKQIAKSMGPMMFPLKLGGNVSYTSRMGKRSINVPGASTYHRGVDIGAPRGTPVYAPWDGTVTLSGLWYGGGYTVQMNHGKGVSTYHLHLNGMPKVRKGDTVKQGDIIGYVGGSGKNGNLNAYGNHLHMEIHVKGMSNGVYKTAVQPFGGFIDPKIIPMRAKRALDPQPEINPVFPNLTK